MIKLIAKVLLGVVLGAAAMAGAKALADAADPSGKNRYFTFKQE